MATETITICVSPEAQQDASLEDIMRDTSRKAQARGLTPEILESILMPYHESWQPLFDSLDRFSDDFMLEREQPDQPREGLMGDL